MPKENISPVAEADDAPLEMDDAAAADLEKAARLLAKAARNRQDRAATLKEVEGVLSKLNVRDFPELAESPIVRSFLQAMGVNDLRPGETRNANTLAERSREWTERDMEQFPTRTFEPRGTMPIIYHGLTYQLIDGQEVTYPEPIYSEYLRVREAQRQAEIDEAYLQGYSDVPPRPDLIVDSSAKVRAFSQLGPRPDARKRGVGFLPNEESEVTS